MTWVNSLGHVLFPFARWQHDHAQTLLPARPPWHVPGQWPQPLARGQGWLYVSTWTSLRLAPVRCRVLLHSLLPTDDSAARLVCQRPSSNFPYFRTPLANFLLSRPNSNSVEYGNSKTTTLLPSAKCTRPLFQGRTGCGGRPSGWHDIVTCQRLVWFSWWIHSTVLSYRACSEVKPYCTLVVTVRLGTNYYWIIIAVH